jgi:hypothetical protein
LSFGTSYIWTGGDDNPPSYVITIQSQSQTSGKNYLYVPNSTASNSQPEWAEQTSDKYKSTWYLEPLDNSVPDKTAVCWRDGFRLKYMWDSTSPNNSWYMVHCVNKGTFTGLKSGGAPPSTADGLKFLNDKFGGIVVDQVSTIFYLLPVSFAFKACSGTNQGVCALGDPFAFDPFNADGLWTYGPYNPAGCVLTHDSMTVVTDGSASSTLPGCSFCPANPNTPPGSQPPPSSGNPPSSGDGGNGGGGGNGYNPPSSAPGPASVEDKIRGEWQKLWANNTFRIVFYALGALLAAYVVYLVFKKVRSQQPPVSG